MKPIQILILAAAVTVSAAAQSASANGQNTGSSTQPAGTAKPGATPASGKANPGGKSSPKGASSTQPSGVKLIVPKPSPGAKNSSATNSGGAKGPGATAASKSGSQATAAKTPAATTKTPVAGNKGASGTASLQKSAGVQNVPVLTVKPAQKTPVQAKGAKAATPKKSVAAKAVAPKKTQVTIVPQKTAGGKKPADNTAPTTITASGRRDPFMSIIRNVSAGPSGPNCSVGKRCLFIPELELKGIAKDPDGQMLAVVVSNTHRAYFLRENDQVFNGSVQKITSDSVVFREFATDHLGRETAHEVVKKIPKS